jgi:hypothetical protein
MATDQVKPKPAEVEKARKWMRDMKIVPEFDEGKYWAVHVRDGQRYRTSEMLAAYLLSETAPLQEEVERLRAIDREEWGILTTIGPITCRNGKQHIHESPPPCLYCVAEAAESALAEMVKAARMNLFGHNFEPSCCEPDQCVFCEAEHMKDLHFTAEKSKHWWYKRLLELLDTALQAAEEHLKNGATQKEGE